uniref:Diacylglycerol kinase, eta n=1 Tax=Latimeria chalumnae TaxID=7897 RepID=H2ZSK0_LATCH
QCDGQYIPLPSLQGIAVLNIPSYAGGTNFWGGTKEDDIFGAPSFDDKILEVVAVFGSMQMAVSRVIKLQHHRIAQCRSVKITILGDEGVPVQVDGEAWIQPPGVIKIVHKNRAQMLTRDRAFENTLKSWEDKLKNKFTVILQSCHLLQNLCCSVELAIFGEPQKLNKENQKIFFSTVSWITLCVLYIIIIIITHTSLLLDHMYQLKSKNTKFITRVKANRKCVLKPLIQTTVSSVTEHYPDNCQSLNIKKHKFRFRFHIHQKTCLKLNSFQRESQFCDCLSRKIGKIYIKRVSVPEKEDKKKHIMNFFFLTFVRYHVDKTLVVQKWGTDEVAAWLDLLSLGEYKEIFIRHDIRGSELLHLERRDLKDLGITKVGHMKRILQGIKELGK